MGNGKKNMLSKESVTDIIMLGLLVAAIILLALVL